MSRLKVQAFSVSIDGFGAGPEQSLENPLGVGGMSLHEWFFHTRTFHEMTEQGPGGDTDIDDEIAKQSFVNIGAWILGRNMFGPVRGPWPDDSWKGWWGNNPPYHVPVFVLTHYPRESITMEGGTTFHFVTGGIHEALERARAAAGGRDIRLGGGVETVRQYVQAGLVDELHLAISPTLLGRGESLLGGIDLTKAGFRCVRHLSSPRALHVFLARE
ncbi:dihydrofolate reductase family protein [Dyella mobilis]|uniref:Dihydrofolate reductase family protein n=1 Tax=Dyella mobilis TaxID=1849582 RepID=A0ABS2KEY2_9GAMM|nr:dihydrofolate reductase family protein [Dyella mobilis]MBM7129499.1 dihydrofolate reductase family protein [Dyella mobilis]GLQ98237.1 deaminase reductase [Dyella mobilis]